MWQLATLKTLQPDIGMNFGRRNDKLQVECFTM
jgi:hypothetical protein